MSTLITTHTGKLLPVTVAPPARAVRKSFVGNELIFTIGDDGGRGLPWMALFVPVAQAAGDRFELVVRNGADDKLLDSIRFRMRADSDGRGPFNFSFGENDRYGEWLQGPAGTLSLLLYAQAQPSEAGFEPNAPDASPGDSQFWRGVREEIVKLLARETRSALDPCQIVLSRGELGLVTPAQPEQPAPPYSRGLAAAPAQSSVTFALASCQYPGDFLDRSPPAAAPGTEGPADASMLRLRSRLDAEDPAGKPELLILCGDQVYVDATAGLFDPTVADDRYRLAYESYTGSLGARRLLPRLSSVVSMLDDHEIIDNWAVGDTIPSDKDVEAALTAYLKEQRSPSLPIRDPTKRPLVLWTEFERLGLPFFLADTRSERGPRRAANFEEAEFISPKQFEALEKFIDATKAGGPAFVVSPSILLPRHLWVARDPASALRSDSWEGYPASFKRLLAYLCDKEHRQLVFLSGDEHVSCFATATITCGKKSATLHSIHSSALYAPYPFANAIPEDFARAEEFDFQVSEGGPLYTCQVESHFPPPGDGFALITVASSQNRHVVEVLFDKGGAVTPSHSVSFTV